MNMHSTIHDVNESEVYQPMNCMSSFQSHRMVTEESTVHNHKSDPMDKIRQSEKRIEAIFSGERRREEQKITDEDEVEEERIKHRQQMLKVRESIDSQNEYGQNPHASQ